MAHRAERAWLLDGGAFVVRFVAEGAGGEPVPSAVVLEPDAVCFTAVHGTGQAERQVARFVTSAWRQRLAAALDLRNQHAPPAACSALEDGWAFEEGAPAPARWPSQWTPSLCERLPGGGARVRTVDGAWALTLHASQRLGWLEGRAPVTQAGRALARAGEGVPRVPVRRMVWGEGPPEARHALAVARARDDPERPVWDGAYALAAGELGAPLDEGALRWAALRPDGLLATDCLAGAGPQGALVGVWAGVATARVVGSGSSVEALLDADDSVLVFDGAVFSHVTDAERPPRVFAREAVPVRTRCAASGKSYALGEVAAWVAALWDGRPSPEQPPPPPPAGPLPDVVLESSFAGGAAKFTLFADGRVRGAFADRTVVALPADRRAADVLLPDGRRTSTKSTDRWHVAQTVRFARWASLPPEERAWAAAEREEMLGRARAACVRPVPVVRPVVGRPVVGRVGRGVVGGAGGPGAAGGPGVAVAAAAAPALASADVDTDELVRQRLAASERTAQGLREYLAWAN